MKKKIILTLIALMSLLSTYASVLIDGYAYNFDITNYTATVVYDESYLDKTSVVIPEYIAYNGINFTITSIGQGAFNSCSNLTSVTIPNSVTSIDTGAFQLCSNLTFVTIPNSVTSIGSRAFWRCTSLSSVTIPNSVTSIGSRAFDECTGLTSVTIPNSVTSIGKQTFNQCTSLTSVTIPNSVTSIGDNAFASCSNLTSVTIPNSVTSIGSCAFYCCTGLTSVTIPNGVTSIGSSAFRKCSGLTSVTIPNSVTSIGNSAFYECTGLSWIIIPNSVTSIGYGAFSWCTNLTSVVWNAKSCGNSNLKLFEYAENKITSFAFGSEVDSIPAGLCSGMSNLTSIRVRTKNPPVCGTDCFLKVPVNIPIYVPCDKEAYSSSSGWQSFTNIIEDREYSVVAQSYSNGKTEIRSYTCDNELTVFASADNHYHFVQWSDGSTANPYSLIVIQDTALTAEFAINTHKISASAEKGHVDGVGEYEFGTTAKLTAIADEHYHFVQWSDGNTDNPRTVYVTGDSTYSVVFTPNSYSISISAKNGRVDGAGTFDFGTTATLTAVADEHYHFAQWGDGNTDNPRIIQIEGDATYTAKFVIDQYTISAATENGHIDGVGEYDYGTTATLTAIANEHYNFTQWSDGSTDNPRTVSVKGDTTYSIVFTPNSYSISISAENGRVDGSGMYDYGTTATLTAVADEHYHFAQWGDGIADNPRIVSVDSNATYIAEFAIDQYTISASSENGRIDGTGLYDYGTTATLTAVADEHYHFAQWGDGNTDNPRIIQIEGDATYTAKFVIDKHTISTSAENGHVYGAGIYDYGTSTTLFAVADEHYHFSQWSDDNTDNPRIISVNGDATYTAEFAIEQFSISASAENGQVYGAGKYDYGTSATLIAVADEHYHFSQWSDGNVDNPRIISINSDATYTAKFIIDKHTISASAENGQVYGAGKYDYGTSATLIAVADEHYHFSQWSDGNTDNPRIVSINGDATYTAVFAPNQYSISTAADNGHVEGAGTYDYSTTTTLTAIADEHYHFVQWSDGYTDNPRTIKIEGDATYTAEFAIDQFTITATYDIRYGEVIGDGVYDYGTQITLTAVPNSGYEFKQWSNGVTDNPYNFMVLEDLSLEAMFIPSAATALENTGIDTTPQKVLIDGQVYILRNGKTYTLTGVEVESL